VETIPRFEIPEQFQDCDKMSHQGQEASDSAGAEDATTLSSRSNDLADAKLREE
jgi:hypothetical protein